MKIIPQSIPDVIMINPKINWDKRGYFFESFKKDIFDKATEFKFNFIQENESKSFKGVLRGLHYQIPPFAQAKLVKVIEGSVLDVALDIRKSSPTFGKHVAVELNADIKNQLFIPHGFAHGFVVLSESATFSYKVDNYYEPKCDRGIAFDDKELAINWQVPPEMIKLSDKDRKHPNLADAIDLFE